MIACHVVHFQRTNTVPFERGLAIVSSPGTSDPIIIVDAAGEIVPLPIWSYALRAWEGTTVLAGLE